MFLYHKPNDPCPLCGGITDCRTNMAGGVHCRRKTQEAPPPGWHFTKVDGIGAAIFHRDDLDAKPTADWATKRIENRKAASAANPKKQMTPASRFNRIARDKEPMTPSQRAWLADHLSLPLGVFDVLGVEFVDDDHNRPTYVFPEVNAAGRVVGYTLRYRDNVKINHGNRGLSIPSGDLWRTNDPDGPILFVEGASGTLAGVAMGLNVIGRPNNIGGVEDLIEFLRANPTKQSLIVIGDNDANNAGRDGAERTAARLAAAIGRQVLVCLPPAGVKDARRLIELQRDDILAKRTTLAAVGQELLAHVAAACYLPPPTGTFLETGQKVYQQAVADLRPLNDATAADFTPTRTTTPTVTPKPVEQCPDPKGVLMRNSSARMNRVMWIDCRRLDCPYCHKKKREQYQKTVLQHLGDLAKSKATGDASPITVNQFWIQPRDWSNASRRLRASHASYFCLKAAGDLYLVVSTELPSTSGVMSPEIVDVDIAARRLSSAIVNVPRLFPKILTYSRDWNLVNQTPKNRCNKWKRTGKVDAPKKVIFDILEYHRVNWQPRPGPRGIWTWIAWEWHDDQVVDRHCLTMNILAGDIVGTPGDGSKDDVICEVDDDEFAAGCPPAEVLIGF